MTQPFTDALTWVPKSRALAVTLARAGDLARAQSHPAVTLEHLLLALIEDPDASSVLLACNVDLLKLNDAVSAHLKQQPAAASVMPDAAPEVVTILEYAVAAARQSKRNEVNGAIVLAAVVGEGNSVAAHLLQALGLTFDGAVQALRKANAPPSRPTASAAPPPVMPTPPPVPTSAAAAAPPPATAPAIADEDPVTTARRRIDAMRSGAPVPAQPQAPAASLRDASPSSSPAPSEAQPSPPSVADSLRASAPASEGDWAPPPLPPATPSRPARMPPPIPPISSPPARVSTGSGGAQVAVPWTDPSAVAAEPQTATVIPFPSTRTGTPIDPARLMDRLTRRMKLNVASTIEVRIPRAAVQATAAAVGAAPDSAVTRALTVRLKAPAGGMTIENAAPETQWFDARANPQEDEVRWRWIVTPYAGGAQPLQLTIGMRTVATDGVTIETALPEHQAEVWVVRPLRPLLVAMGVVLGAAACGALAMLTAINGIGAVMRLFG